MLSKWFIVACAAGLMFALVACDVDVEKEGKLPDVDVDATGGQLPEFKQTQEAQMPDVDVDATSGKLPDVDVRTPDVDVSTDTVEVPVPDIDVDVPEEHEPVSKQ